ncbi:MOSC domain-containing protein [Streptomyces sp. CA2R106]|uniref:MOSC domain-containing protein n=1 Tax=Streptomyces sp. CA2R106 TaxID=3120153 RepID=UPI003008FFEB
MAPEVVGSVALLRRFPVKSMLGERLPSLVFDERGVAGDRLWAVRFADGKHGAGKHTPRFRTVEGLRYFSACYEEGGEPDGQAGPGAAVPCVVFPDGTRWRGDTDGIHRALSDTLGREVTLAREAGVSLLDAGPGIVHLLTTATVAYVRGLLAGSDVDERRFRPNLLLDVDDPPGPVEDAWVGRSLSIGTARFTVVEPTERCVMVNHDRDGMPYDGRILKALYRATAMHAGVYAKVVTPGTVRAGDKAWLSA